MTSSPIPGVIVNTSRKNGAVRDAKRMGALERAASLLGQAQLAEAMGIGVRQLHAKISAERPIHGADLRIAAAALDLRVKQMLDLGDRLTALASKDQ